MGCAFSRMACATTAAWAVWAVGCAQQSVEFTDVQCQVVRDGEQLRHVVFSASLHTTGLEDQQLIYRVSLFDDHRRPVKSSDGRFEMSDGTVAAARTFMVLHQDQSFRDLRMKIPADQLEIREDHLPARAQYGIFDLDGNMLAVTSRRLPITSLRHVRPPLAEDGLIPESFWFVRSHDGGLPILLGPFAGPEEAMACVANPMELPRRYRESELVWFLPVREDDADTGVSWLGPFASLIDAEEAACLLEERLPNLHQKTGKEDHPVIMLPTQIPLLQGMAQPTHLTDLP